MAKTVVTIALIGDAKTTLVGGDTKLGLRWPAFIAYLGNLWDHQYAEAETSRRDEAAQPGVN